MIMKLFLAVAIAYLGFAHYEATSPIFASASLMVGGIGPLRTADAATQTIADSVKSQVLASLNGPSSLYQAVSYKTQVVAGFIYYIKVRMDSGYVVIKVWDTLQGKYDLLGVQQGHTEHDEISYF